MTDFVKRKIVEKLAKFTKDLKPSDISLGFLTGKGILTNLELNCNFITEALQLPPWIHVTRVTCDRIRARVPFTNLRNEPIQIVIDTVEIDVSTATDDTSRKMSGNLLDKLGSNSPSKYGFSEKVIDGMKVEIRSIVVNFHDPAYQARLEISDILIQSTTPEWRPATLALTRYKNQDEDSVVIYKMCDIGNMKLEGWILGGGEGVGDRAPGDKSTKVKLRLIAGETNIRFTLKRKMEDCRILHTRVVVKLGDVTWVLSQSQLQAVSRLVQTLMTAAVAMTQRQREEREALLGDDSGSVSGESMISEEGSGSHGNEKTKNSKPKKSRKRADTKSDKKRRSRGLTQKEILLKKKMYEYRSGLVNMPTYEVIQDSVHIQTGNIDLQFCDDSPDEKREREDDEGRPQSRRSTVDASMLIRLKEVHVDVYLDQPAGSGKHHWNKANDLILRNVRWSEELIKKASKTQHMDLPSVSLQYLRERGIVIRCADFTIESLCSSDTTSPEAQLPLLTADKKTFNIPEDVHNPAFQEYGTKFLIPRPNIYIHLSPLHATIHQPSLLWIMDFMHSVLATVNLDLAMTVRSEGKAFLEERKAQKVPTHQLPGVDLDFKILFSKVTIPLPNPSSDGRPRALQLETASINIKNHSIDTLLQDSDFKAALEGVDNGWIFATHGSGEFPHFPGDLPCVQPWLREMLNYKLRDSRLGLVAELPSSPLERSSSPIVVQNSELMYTESWHFHTACVHLSFTKTDQYQDTLRPKDFVKDFPLHLWLFLPRERRGEGGSNFSSQGAVRDIHGTPTRLFGGPMQGNFDIEGTAGISQSQDPQISKNSAPLPLGLRSPSKPHTDRPLISFIAHVSDPIHAELERLQFLFLLRLKDSFTDLKNSMLKFLSLVSLNEEEKSDADVLSPTTPLPSNRHNTLVSGEDWEPGECVRSEFGDGGQERETDTNTQRQSESEVQSSNPVSSEQVPNGKNKSASIAGCIIVRSVQADILLPTIFNEKTRGVVASGKNTPVNSPLSPSSPPPPSDLTQSPLSTPTRLLSPPQHAPSPLTHPPSQLTSSHTLSVHTQPSITDSQSSLLSQTSFQALTSQSQPVYSAGLTGQTGLTGSQTSLPILFEGGQRSSGSGDDVISLHGYRHSTFETQQLALQGPGRSLSASNLAPGFGKTTPTLAPSSLSHTTSSDTGRSLSHSPSSQSSPVSQGDSSHHHGNRSYVMVQSLTIEEGTHLDTRSLASGGSLELGREMRENSPSSLPPSQQQQQLSTQQQQQQPLSTQQQQPLSTQQQQQPLSTQQQQQPLSTQQQQQQLSTQQQQQQQQQLSTQQQQQQQLLLQQQQQLSTQQQQQQQLLIQQQQQRTNLTLIVNDITSLVTETGLTGASEGGEGERSEVVRVGGVEGTTEESGRKRIPSFDRQEMGDTLTPLTETIFPQKLVHSIRRASTASSLRSNSSVKREKPPPLMHSEPLYILRVNARGICILPNIQASEISIRVSVNHVKLKEITASDVKEEDREGERRGVNESVWGSAPVIRARLEVGAQVQRFNLQPSSVNDKEQDAIVMLALSKLEAELLLKNATVMKDFFDDEYESDSPIPIQLRIEDTSFVLRESLDHTADTDSTMNVCIKSAEIHRGRKVKGTNLFPSQVLEVSSDPVEERALRLTLDEMTGLRDTSPAAVSTDSSSSANADLLHTFRSFVQVFESHVRRHGGLKVQLSQPEHIAGLLQELEVSLSEEEEQETGTGHAPPSYSETLKNASTTQPHVRTSSQVSTTTGSPPQNSRLSLDSPTMKSRTMDLRKLRQESQELIRLQIENDDLISQLMQAKMLLAERSQDLDEVTSECKKAKEELVTHKQVLENYQEHIEKLLTENADLKMTSR